MAEIIARGHSIVEWRVDCPICGKTNHYSMDEQVYCEHFVDGYYDCGLIPFEENPQPKGDGE